MLRLNVRQLYFWREKNIMQSVFIPQQRPRPRVKPSRDRSPPWLQSRNLSSSSRLRLPRYDRLSISTSSTKVSDTHTQKRIIWSTLGETSAPSIFQVPTERSITRDTPHQWFSPRRSPRCQRRPPSTSTWPALRIISLRR